MSLPVDLSRYLIVVSPVTILEITKFDTTTFQLIRELVITDASGKVFRITGNQTLSILIRDFSSGQNQSSNSSNGTSSQQATVPGVTIKQENNLLILMASPFMDILADIQLNSLSMASLARLGNEADPVTTFWSTNPFSLTAPGEKPVIIADPVTFVYPSTGTIVIALAEQPAEIKSLSSGYSNILFFKQLDIQNGVNGSSSIKSMPRTVNKNIVTNQKVTTKNVKIAQVEQTETMAPPNFTIYYKPSPLEIITYN